MVPKKGLEPPHPCGYMDLNHARLPIPPLRQGDAPDKIFRRCDGKNSSSILKGLPHVSNAVPQAERLKRQPGASFSTGCPRLSGDQRGVFSSAKTPCHRIASSNKTIEITDKTSLLTSSRSNSRVLGPKKTGLVQ